MANDKPKNPNLFDRLEWNDGEKVDYDTDITLRDLFAAVVLQALCQNAGMSSALPGNRGFVAMQAYAVADQMLKAREGE